MNKLSMLRGYGVAAIACGIALMIAGPLNAESSCFVLAVIVSSLFGGRGPGFWRFSSPQSPSTFSSFHPLFHCQAPRHPIYGSACFSWWLLLRAN